MSENTEQRLFIGRKEEIKELEARFESGRFEFGVLYGARRIGKTSLIKHFSEGRNAFVFQARRGTEDENLRIFTKEFNEFRGISTNYTFASFENALDEVAEYARNERFFFAIDEVSYLCSRSKAFLSTFQAYIDGKFKDANIVVVLSGSNISFMKDILNDRSDPLYKRASFQMNIRKMPLSEALEFLDGLSDEEKLQYLALFGTHPYYLSMIDKEAGFDENIKRLIFGRFSTLLDAPEKVLPSGLTEQNMSNSILRAIAHRRRSSKEISDYVGAESNYISGYLATLCETETIEKREAFKRNRKQNYYEISDKLIRFWYRFIYENKEAISLGAGEALYDLLKDDIFDFIARAFEDTAISYMEEQNAKERLPKLYGPIRNYIVDNSALGRSIELDGLAESLVRPKSSLLVIECKYRKSKFTKDMFEHLEESASIFEGYKSKEYYLFSLSGFSDDLKSSAAENVHFITAEEVLRIDEA